MMKAPHPLNLGQCILPLSKLLCMGNPVSHEAVKVIWACSKNGVALCQRLPDPPALHTSNPCEHVLDIRRSV